MRQRLWGLSRSDSSVNSNSQSFISESALDHSRRTLSDDHSTLVYSASTAGTSENPITTESSHEKPTDLVLETPSHSLSRRRKTQVPEKFMARGDSSSKCYHWCVNRRCWLRRGTVDHIFLKQQMPGLQLFRITLGTLETSGGYHSKTSPSGRNESRLSFDHIFKGPENHGVMLTYGRVPIRIKKIGEWFFFIIRYINKSKSRYFQSNI